MSSVLSEVAFSKDTTSPCEGNNVRFPHIACISGNSNCSKVTQMSRSCLLNYFQTGKEKIIVWCEKIFYSITHLQKENGKKYGLDWQITCQAKTDQLWSQVMLSLTHQLLRLINSLVGFLYSCADKF